MRRLLLSILIVAGLATGQTAKFPASVAADADLLKAYDRAASVLASGIDDSTLSIPVTDGSSFAGATNFSVTIDNERILIASVSGNTLTVASGGRGFSGSAPASHTIGAPVRATITAWHHNALASEIKAIEQALGPSLSNVVKTSGSYTDPDWLTISKSKVGLGNVENTALSTWTGSTNITTIGALNSHVKAPKQINFTLYDPNTSIPASTIPGIWRAEYGNITATAASCSADTGDAVIQLTGIALSGNLTCSSGGWATSTSFSTATLAQGGSIGLQVVSGTAKRINVSIKYNQQ